MTNWSRGTRFCPSSAGVASRPDRYGFWKCVRVALCFSSLLFAVDARAQWNPLNPVISVEQQADGAKFRLQTGTLQVQICSDTVLRVVLTPPSPVAAPENLVILKDKWAPVKWAFAATDDAVSLTTAELRVTVARRDSSVTFSDLGGKKLFQQIEASLTPVVVNSENTFHS